MKSSKLKETVISQIQHLDNDGLIEEIYELLKLESDDPELYILNPDQILAVEEAQGQVKNGNFLTDDQAQADFDAWLKK